MSKVTAIRMGRGRGKRVNVLLDGRLAFSLEMEVAAKEGLQIGQELSANQIEALISSDSFQRCLIAATNYLSYRNRSESELRERLQRRGFDDDNVEAVIAKLREEGLINDMTFAQFWKDNRELFSPRSQWLTKLELRRKGVAEDIIDKVVDAIDDHDSAYRAAWDKSRSLSMSDQPSFHHRLTGYLRRRGFSYEVINHTVEQLWQEQKRET